MKPSRLLIIPLILVLLSALIAWSGPETGPAMVWPPPAGAAPAPVETPPAGPAAQAAEALQVIEVQPANGSVGLPADTVITVFFNRPVVVLSSLEDGATLPSPIQIEPPVAGRGEWLNTSTFQFTPGSAGLRRATDYTVRVPAGLSDAFGQATLAETVEWRFSTIAPTPTPSPTPIPTPAPPLVAELFPENGAVEVSPWAAIRLVFNKPMYRQEVEEQFKLVYVADGSLVPGGFTWQSEPEGFTFTPAEPLKPAGHYRLELPAGVRAEYGQEATLEKVEATFSVAPDPVILDVYPPPDGILDPGQTIQISFNTPMRRDSLIVGRNLLITPTVPITQIYPYWRDNDTTLAINLPLNFSQVYTLTVRGSLAGQHGQLLGQDRSFTWPTRAQAALLFIESPGPLATYNAYTETTVLLTTRNVGQVDLALYRMPVADLMKLYQDNWRDEWDFYQADPANLLHRWSFTPPQAPNQRKLNRLSLGPATGLGDALPPGLYYLAASVPEDQLYSNAGWTSNADPLERQVLVVSKYNITLKDSGHEALAWLTDLHSGRPVAGQPVTFVNGTAPFKGETGQDGVAQVSFGRWREPGELRFAFAGDPEQPGDNFAMAVSRWNQGIYRYNFRNIRTENSAPYYSGHFYTHRALYRPGETVRFKGIIRAADDSNYSLPPANRRVSVLIFDEQGQEVYNRELPLSAMGTVNDTFSLAREAGLGIYQLQASYAGQTFYDEFEVSAYRPPEFAVEVQTDRVRYGQGETINVSVSANFFFGGPVSNARVRWALLSDDFAPRSGRLDAFDFVNEAYGADFIEDSERGFGPQIAGGEGQTGPDGRYTFRVTADIASKLSTQLYTFDVVITDINNQEVATQARVLVHKGAFLVGLQPEQFVGAAGQENRARLLVVDWAAQPVAGQAVEVSIAEYNRYSVQRLDPELSYYTGRNSFYWETIDEEVEVFTATLTTDDRGEAVAVFNPARGGIYKIYARAIDEAGNLMQSSAFTWISGDDYINWGQRDNDRFEPVADKKLYQAGDTAHILIPHPFNGPATALVTLERGHIYDHFVVELPANSSQVSIPITEALLPNIYVSIVVVKGVDEANPLPSFSMGYVNLPIDPARKLLQIELMPDKAAGESYQPRETVAYDIQVTDALGQPVQAELSLALVDQAVLSLAPEKPGRILQDFWHSRGLAVENASGLTLAIDRFNQAVMKVKGGDGGCVDCGGFEKGFGATRLKLLDTALWLADFITDEQGRGRVEAELPDNLTTWTLTGIGVTGASTLVGESAVDIVSTKPLLVRPVAPRFFINGDQAQLGVIVQNNTSKTLPVELKFEAEGLAIGDWRVGRPVEEGPVGGAQGGQWSSQGSPSFSLEAGKRLKVEYRVTVEQVAAARLTMGAKSTDNLYGDALAFEVPVYRESTPETVATAGQLDTDGSRTEGIALPGSFDPTQGELTVNLEPSLAAGMKAGLTFLEHFPYECTEQTVSRFLPNAVTYRAYRTLNLENPELAAKLPEQVGVALQRLYQYHHFDGGWGWWANDDSNPYLTAYVLLGLIEAERAGFAPDREVFQAGLDYLSENLAAPDEIKNSWQANRHAFMLYVLAEAGRGDLGRMLALYEQRRQLLDLFGKAYLAMALHRLESGAPQLEALLNDIHNAAITGATGLYWQESQTDYRAMNTDTRTTALIIAALARIDPGHPSLPNAVRWLMSARKHGGYWQTTQETAWAIIGLTGWLLASGELNGNYAWRAALNDEELGAGRVEAGNIDELTRLQVEVGQLLAGAANRLVIERSPAPGVTPDGESSPGRLYYSAYLTYYKPVAEVEPLARGIKISREYRRSNDDLRQSISEARLGDLIEVHLIIEAANDLHYVLVEDPLPAGAEPINTSLAITSLADQEEAAAFTDDRRFFSHTELRDEKAVLFATYLPRGRYTYTYLIRAALPGRYHVIPSHAEEMYFPEVFGRGQGSIFVIEE